MRVVIDTNVFISGVFFGGKPRKVLDLIEEKVISPCFTPATFAELEHLLYQERFTKQRKLLSFPIEDFLTKLRTCSLLFLQPSKIPLVIRDDLADNYFLACAISSGAFFIISGDKHLLKLKKFQEIPILTPREFLNKLRK